QPSGSAIPVVVLPQGTADADQLAAVTVTVVPVQCRQVQRVAPELPGRRVCRGQGVLSKAALRLPVQP
ncbi:hypothetical protein, partial [Enterobacter cloacae]